MDSGSNIVNLFSFNFFNQPRRRNPFKNNDMDKITLRKAVYCDERLNKMKLFKIKILKAELLHRTLFEDMEREDVKFIEKIIERHHDEIIKEVEGKIREIESEIEAL